MTEMFPGSGFHVGCAVHHTDGEGNAIPCPGYPHAEPPRRFADFDLEDCPHCDEPQPAQQMDAHVSFVHADLPPCTARIETEHRETYTCSFRAGHTKGRGEYGAWHASRNGSSFGSRYVWNDTAPGATPHQPTEPSDSLDGLKGMGVLSHTVVATGGDQPEPEPDEQQNTEKSRPEPPSDEEMNTALPVYPDPRQLAYDAVYEYIRRLSGYLPPDPVHRNAVIWRAVHAALNATPVGRCVSSHCVEGDHILPVEQEA